MHVIDGVVQHYGWGDPTAIPTLLARPPDGRPWAELWLGTHPGGPARLADGTPLGDLTGELPYLMKLLAAAEPLSLQTHPTTAQAEAGFAREEAADVALDDSHRIYRDRSAKPELLCAVTPFEALCGLRDPRATHDWFVELGWDELAALLADGDLAAYLDATLRNGSLALPSNLPSYARRLAESYPDEPGGVAAALALNHVELVPGEALLLDAGNLHMYLTGLGVEVMAASDNVVRAAFTSKHVDVDEVLRVLDPSVLDDPVVRPREVEPGVFTYPSVTDAFELTRLEVDGTLDQPEAVGPELLICTGGDTEELPRGAAGVVLPGEPLTLTGRATLFRCRARS